ncbi:hypothetical protein Cni_G11806 [Canna indica]|uniref:Uncharacterized protein n=1 Tax=Canna indica TaxID=4628 RepID=A0AAQ3KCE2_9LILI|nr:hypothetical protein Cni_G11806 [Canna indica]
MGFSPLSLQNPLVLIIPFFLTLHVNSQTINTNTTLFSCSPNTSASCSTFVLYRTQVEFLDLKQISDLFGVSSLWIKEVNHLPSEEGTLFPDQLIAIPLTCGCTGNRSFANTTYWIKEGDSYYVVSTQAFQGLVDYHFIEDLNPTLDPSNLQPGQDVTVPVYCKCPEKTQLDQGIKYLMTYVWSAEDDISKLSNKTNSSVDSIRAANNYRNFSAAVSHAILIPVKEKPNLPAPLYNTTASSGTDHESSKSNTKAIVLWSIVAAASAVVIWNFLLLAWCKIYRNKLFVRTASNSEAADHLLTPKKSSKNQSLCPLTKGNKLLAGVSQFIDKPAMFDVKDIMEATMNMSRSYWIEGSVYQATINEEVYAVKLAKGDVAEEMHIFQFVNHANLIKLAGFSIHGDGNFLWVYEYAENGSLDKWLFPKTSSSSSSSSDSISCLSWRHRLNIALDVANGLQYLHEHTRPSIVHRAIKSSNILLDAHFKAKISNFSSAKPATMGVRPSADVFDFGVVLLELLSGRKERSSEDAEVGVLWREIRAVLEVEEKKVERLRRWMDPKMKGNLYPMEGAISLAAMAKACTVEDSTERPRISEIVFGLSVLAQSWSTEAWMPSSEESIPIADAVVAR